MRLTVQQQRLAEENHNLIYYVLKQKNLSINEYYDVAAIGLCKAASAFDKSKGKFSTYACVVMLNEIRMSFRTIKRHNKLAVIESLDDPIPGTEEITLADIIPAVDTPETYFAETQIRDCISRMKPNYRRVVKLAAQGLNQYQIADAMGISQSQISHILKRAKQELSKQI